MTWKENHKLYMELFCQHHNFFGHSPHKGRKGREMAELCLREVGGCKMKRAKCQLLADRARVRVPASKPTIYKLC